MRKLQTASICHPMIALLALTACNSGGGATAVSPGTVNPSALSFADAATTGTVPLSFASLNAANNTTTSGTGSLDRTSGDASIAGLSGNVDAARRLMQITSGGQVALTANPGRFAVRYQASPQGTQTTTGVVGVSTLASDMPTSGSATYSGDTQLSAQVGTSLYELTGTAAIAASFGSGGTVTTTLSGLSGQRIPTVAAASSVSNVGTITLSGASVSGTGFAGGTSATTGSTLALSGTQTTSVSGQFFGPQATEAGGVFVINDTTGGGPLIQGDFLGN